VSLGRYLKRKKIELKKNNGITVDGLLPGCILCSVSPMVRQPVCSNPNIGGRRSFVGNYLFI